ncbi:hypothetical protein HN446_02200 [bacterium]|nr:hypothetical protein [bacterium]
MNRKCFFLVFVLGISTVMSIKSNNPSAREAFVQDIASELIEAEEKAHDRASFILSVQFPEYIDCAPNVRVYKDGKRLESLESSSTIDEKRSGEKSSKPKNNRLDLLILGEQEATEFEVFISGNVEPKNNSGKNTIESWEIPENTPFIKTKFIKVISKPDKDEKQLVSWEPVPDEKDETSVVIRKHNKKTMVTDGATFLVIPAELIDRLEPGTKSEIGHTSILPKICIKESVPKQEIYALLINSLLASINIDTFHVRPENTTKVSNVTIVKTSR